MKRLVIVLILALILPNVGCQRMRRGARCRPGLPTYNQSHDQGAAPCTSGYMDPTVGSYAPSPPAGVMMNTPVEGQVYTQQRPIITDTVVSGPVVSSPSSTSVTTVPGPESAPIPGT